MAIKEYDVFIIGTGTAGKSVAYDCAAEGMKVAIADNGNLAEPAQIEAATQKKFWWELPKRCSFRKI